MYCFNGLGFAAKSVLVTPEAGGSTLLEAFTPSALIGPDRSYDGPDRFENGNPIPGPHFPENCPGAEQASVVITDSERGNRPDDLEPYFAGFYVVFN